jgi:hypothetical protein
MKHETNDSRIQHRSIIPETSASGFFEKSAREALHNCPLASLLQKNQTLAYRKYASALTFLRALPANNSTALPEN